MFYLKIVIITSADPTPKKNRFLPFLFWSTITLQINQAARSSRHCKKRYACRNGRKKYVKNTHVTEKKQQSPRERSLFCPPVKARSDCDPTRHDVQRASQSRDRVALQRRFFSNSNQFPPLTIAAAADHRKPKEWMTGFGAFVRLGGSSGAGPPNLHRRVRKKQAVPALD